jgi:hypothetical protein
MNTEHGQPPGHPPESIRIPINQRLFDLEKERLRLVTQYDEIMTRVEEGDDTGFTLTRITKRLSDVNREIERVRGTSS